jgi:hypothetical protein
MDTVVEGADHRAWTDVVGLHEGPGATFRGKEGSTNYFHFCIPTLPWRDGAVAQVAMVSVLYHSDVGVEVQKVYVFDGPNLLRGDLPIGGTAGVDLTGVHWPDDLVENVTRWDIQPLDVHWGLGISVQVFFAQDGQITFTAAGADFLV